jgi:hypothetical protein
MSYTRDKRTLLTVYFAFYYAVFLFFFIDDRLLSQYQPFFFNFNRDLTELALLATGIPKWMIGHPRSFLMADVTLLLLPAALLGYYVRKGRFSVIAGVLFSCCLGLYLLLANIFWQVHAEPFVLYFLLSFLFWTNREDRFYRLLAGCRYYFLYIFFSAAIWKLARGAVFNVEEMSRILLVHHSDLLSGPCDSWSCRGYLFLIGHPGLSWCLYAAGVLLEFSFVIGFFTRRWDRVLLGLAVVFVVADLLVMRIPYWTVLMGGVTLWLGRRGTGGLGQRGSATGSGRREAAGKRGLVIYETTHHENLPALLDLSAAQFGRVVVFLRPVSYDNLSGPVSPAERWPGTEFIVQEEDCSNRAFIRRMFVFLRKERIGHLHLSTLDNNLLFFAVQLWFYSDLPVSLTVHEVNEYFARSFASFRDWTETAAKLYLRGRIRHYTFFLPAMVERFKKRLPGVVAVFIPSRFYEMRAAGPEPGGRADDPVATRAGRPFRVVIPGSVDGNRREYELVLSFFTNWLGLATHPPRAIELVILGDSATPYGMGIVGQLQRLESPGFRLVYYSGYIPALVYEQQIETADVLWSPLRVNKKSSRHSPEIYGQTTASGLTADLLLNHAPALAPVGFVLPESFRTALLSYGSPEELEKIFVRLLEDTAYVTALRQQIHQAFSFFIGENFSAAFRLLTGLDQPPVSSLPSDQES